MDRLRRIVLVRHGETAGQSSIRYYGATDVPLSDLGRAQVRAAREQIELGTIQAVWASTLCRSWESAQILAPKRRVHLEASFREIDFGDWEGLTKEEIAVADPEGHARWEREGLEFAFPGGESREALRARVAGGLARLRGTGVESALVAVHKGVVRALLEQVTGETLPADRPELGGVVQAWRDRDGVWRLGRLGNAARVRVTGVR